MNRFKDKNDLACTIEAAAIFQKLEPDEQRDALNIIRGYGLAKGVEVILPNEPEPPQNNKSA